MPLSVRVSALLSVTIKHVIVGPGGIYRYKRRVPKDLHATLGDLPVVRSLKTRDPKVAAVLASKLDAENEALWASLRGAPDTFTPEQTKAAARLRLESLGLKPGEAKVNPEGWHRILDAHETEHGRAYGEARHLGDEDVAAAMLTPVNREMERLFAEGVGKRAIMLSDARDSYVKAARNGEDPRFIRDTDRAYDALRALVGDLPIEAYTREHARQLRDAMVASGVRTTTVRRQLNPLVAIFNEAIREHGLAIPNHFKGLKIDREQQDAETRHTFTVGELRTIAAACRRVDDYKRHILAIQLDTGARLAEVVGLRVSDVVLNHLVPHMLLREDRGRKRSLKTDASARQVHLVGEALWAAQQAVQAIKSEPGGSGWLFPGYASDAGIKANSASATLNKWLGNLLGGQGTTHGFRHAMKDRLREADVPQVIQNRILGHSAGSVGESYGEGHSLAKLREHLSKVVLPPEGSS